MKTVAVIFALVATLAPQSASAFAFQKPMAARRSALSMSVEQGETKDTIKVGVIGMGRIGLVHLEAITKAPGVTPIIVSNPTISKAEAGALR
jgi:threonine dehydrogenase-like Zn-dependent dehydrogenase